MRLLASKSWMVCAASVIVCGLVPLATTSATGAPTTAGANGASATPTNGPGVKVKGSDEATPAPITYNTIDGIWEIQLQQSSNTTYSHFKLLTSGDGVSGEWLRDKVHTAVTGTQTGDHFSFNGADGKGAFTLTGYIENSATMIGQFTQGSTTIAFTATHQGLPFGERAPKQSRRRRHKGAALEVTPAAGSSAAPTPVNAAQ